jgi:hypothetical protein
MNTIVSKSPIVRLEWLDSAQPVGTWVHLNETDLDASSAVRCVSVGFEVWRGSHVTVLAPNVGEIQCPENEQASGLIRIPARCIVARRVLENAMEAAE